MRNLALILLALELQGCYLKEGLSSNLLTAALGSSLMLIVGLVPVIDWRAWRHLITWAVAFAFSLALLVACTPAQAAPLDMQRAGDSICQLESRHLNNPLLAIGDGGQSRGECQISIDTALWLVTPQGEAVERGFVPAYMRIMAKDREAFKWFLHYPPINRGLADAYLDKIKRDHKVRTIERLAELWNAGINSTPGAKSDAVAFAGEVRIMYLGPPKASRKER